MVQHWENLGKLDFLVGVKIWNFWKFQFFKIFYHHNDYCVKVWAKMNLNSWFYNTFNFQGFCPENSDFSTNVLYQNGHKFWYHEILLKCVICIYVKSKKVLRVHMHAPLQCQTQYRGWSKFASPPAPHPHSWNRVNPFNARLIFQKSHLAQTMCLFVLYNHAKNREGSWSWLGEKDKISCNCRSRLFQRSDLV